MTETLSRRYKWGKLIIQADFSRPESQIRYTIEQYPDTFDFTPYQVADARHSVGEAFKLVNAWLKSEWR